METIGAISTDQENENGEMNHTPTLLVGFDDSLREK
jgi:hypothetical protein